MRNLSNHFMLLNLLTGVGLFIAGFMPYVPPDGSSENGERGPPPPWNAGRDPPIVGKVVLIVIDAWRWSFLYPFNETPMTHTRKHTAEMGFTKLARTGTPTVTLPRIKALVSGTLPGFVDVVVNLSGQKMDKDSWVRQARTAGKKLIFFGDDTWLSLFPDTFSRYDGTVSFFVNDYTEVDNNVTRHLDDELNRDDWDVMILHYLGLDHIGHTLGPKSSAIHAKLKEMDEVIDKITSQLVKVYDDGETPSPPLVVICGDHGMNDGGSHGGSSGPEVETPLVFISPVYRGTRRDLGFRKFSETDRVEQVDLATTMSILMSQPIPASSVGRFISEAWPSSAHGRRLNCSKVTYNHLLSVCRAHMGDCPDACVLPSDHMDEASLDQASKCLQDAVLNLVADYDLYKMFVGTFLVALTLLVASLKIMKEESRWTNAHPPEPAGTSPLALKCGLAIFFWTFLSFLACRWFADSTSSEMCPPYRSYFSASVGVLVWSSIASTFVDLIWHLKRLDASFPFSINHLILVVPALLAFATGSTSFIEEEHFCWYTLASTLAVVISLKNTYFVGTSLLLPNDQSHGDGNVTSFDLTSSKPTTMHWVRVSAMLILLRVLRSWNQTGDKWVNLTDVADFLNEPANSGWLLLSVTVGLALMAILILASQETSFVKIMMLMALPFVYAYHAQAAGLCTASWWSSRGKYEARIVFVIVILGCCGGVVHYLTERLDSQLRGIALVVFLRKLRLYLAVLAALLGKTHNVLHLALDLVLQEVYFPVASSFMYSDRLLRPAPSALLCHWIGAFVMGMASFFAQGNSNSLATIHIASGYVGLEGHSMAIAGVLLVLSTYSRLLLWMMRAGEELAVFCSRLAEDRPFCDQRGFVRRFKSSFVLALLWVRGLPLAVFLVVLYVSREHLFIWTVFAPKLLYDGMSVLICVLLSLLMLL